MIQNDISLYFHIPYCLKKCPYCDFNSYSIREGSKVIKLEEESYIQSLIEEFKNRSSRLIQDYKLKSIFFGGGTPSLLKPESIGAVIDHVKQVFDFEDELEITLEANPATLSEQLDIDKLVGFYSAGINRLSFGSQSFIEKKLKFLGRLHTPSEIRSAFLNARKAGFKNINLDIIYGLRDESLEDINFELRSLFELDPEHVSLYQLTIEPGTEFYKLSKVKGAASLTAGEEAEASYYQHITDSLSRSGYHRYEISNYSKSGYECRHNLGYWHSRYYLGLGAGAHSFLPGSGTDSSELRSVNLMNPTDYIKSVVGCGHALQREESLSFEDRITEIIYTGLRTEIGVRFDELGIYYAKLNDGLSLDLKIRKNLERLSSMELLDLSESGFKLSKKGFLLANSVIAEIIE